jgi:hypothetical protein
MSWETLTDAALTLSIGTFGKAVTYTPSVGSPRTIKGVFSRQSVEVTRGEYAGVSSFQPTLGIRLADLATAPTSLDRVTVSGTEYRIVECQEDGQGGALLILKKHA